MAGRCGCSSSQCTCALKDGLNTTVTGNGSASNPYKVNVSAIGNTTGLDTNTVDITVTPGTNHVVSADVIVDNSDPHNILAAGPAGLSAIPCVSTDPNNSLTFGADGCLFAPAATAGVLVADTNSIDMSLTGGNTISGDVRIDPSATNLLPAVTGPNGLLVDLITACGLSGEGNAASPLTINTNATPWPYPCPQTNGSPVYCDPATGGLHVDPMQNRLVIDQTLTSVAGTAEVNAIGVPIGGPPAVFGPTFTGTFTNPNPCRPMVVVVNGGVKHFNMRADTGGRLQFQYGLQLTLTGPAAGVYTPNGSHVQFMADGNRNGADPNWDFIWDTVATTQFTQFVLPPGASFNYTLQGIAQLTNYNGDGQVGTLIVFAHFDGQTI